MKMSLPSFLTIALLAVPVISPLNPLVAHAQTTAADQANQLDAQDDQGTPRVARLDFIQGDVSFERAGDKDWVEAVKNLPLLTGDQIYTGDRSGAVIQLARGTFIRLSERTALAITDLSEQGVQFEITAGSAVVQVYRLQDAFGRFEIDTPVAATILQQDGAYRVQVTDNGETEFTTRDGLAEATTEDGTLKVRPGFKLQAGGKGSGKLDVVAVTSFDDWDLGGPPLDTTIDAAGITTDPGSSASPDYVASYQDTYSSLYGLDELSGCGTWTNLPSYGNCWIPRVGYGWAPYRSGRWLYIPALGWTWLPNEPWGWAPYHYGRWSFIPGLGWAWVPGFGPLPFAYAYGYSYYSWRPALVCFFNYPTPGGRYIGWQPLRPGEVWHRPGWYERHHGQPGWGHPVYHPNNGVSVLPVAAFNGSASGRPEAPNREHSRVLQGIDRPRAGIAGISSGLAGVQPGKLAQIPVRPVAGAKTPVVQPPSGIIGRAVVTRHLPEVAAGEGNQVPRERRLVEPVAPPRAGNRDSGIGSAGETNSNSGGQGNGSRGVKPRTPSFDGAASREGGSNTQGSRAEDRRIKREQTDSTGANGTAGHKDKGTSQGQYNTEQRRSESPRHEAPKSSGGTGGSGGHGNSGTNSSQPHTDSNQHSGGGQGSGSGSHNNGQGSNSSGHSGGQSSSSPTPSKKN